MKPLVQVSAADVAGVTHALRRGSRRRAGRVAGGRSRRARRGRRGSPPGSSTTASPSSSRRAGRRMPRSACCSPPRPCGRAPPRRRPRSAVPGSGCSPCRRTTSRARRCSCARSSRARSPWCSRASTFDPAAFAAASAQLDRRVPRYTSLVPVQLAPAARGGQRRPHGRRRAARVRPDPRSAGRPRRRSLILAADALGVRVTRTYGSSETAGGCVYDGRALDGVARAHRRRRRRAVGADARRRLPRRSRAHRARPSRPTPTARAGIARATSATSRTTAPCASRGRADDVIISGGVKVVARRGRAGGAVGPRLRRCRRRALARPRVGRAGGGGRGAHGCRRGIRCPHDPRRGDRRRGAARPPPGPCASSSSTACRCSPRASPTAAPSRSWCAAAGPSA